MRRFFAYKVDLVPHSVYPGLLCMDWREEEVSFVDVIRRGLLVARIQKDGEQTSQNKCNGVGVVQHSEDIFRMLSRDEWQLENAADFSFWAGPVPPCKSYTFRRQTEILSTGDYLDKIKKEMLFTAEVFTIEDATKMARNCLERVDWTCARAERVLHAICNTFQECRDYVKALAPGVSITSGNDFQNIGLEEIILPSVYDGRTNMLLQHWLPSAAIRKSAGLQGMLTEDGYIALSAPYVACRLGVAEERGTRVPYILRFAPVAADGQQQVRWLPKVSSLDERPLAKSVRNALEPGWLGASTDLVFTSSMERTAEFVQERWLNKTYVQLTKSDVLEKVGTHARSASIGLKGVCMESVCLPRCPSLGKRTANEIKDILRDYGQKLTGRKKVLSERLVSVIAAEYAKQAPDIIKYFQCHPFVRYAAGARGISNKMYSLLGKVGPVEQAVVHIVVNRYSRGGVVLDGNFEDTSVPVATCAEALVNGSLASSGTYRSYIRAEAEFFQGLFQKEAIRNDNREVSGL